MESRLMRLSRQFSAVALVLGFIIDYFTLWRIDLWVEELIFISYLSLALFLIIYLSFNEARADRSVRTERLHIGALFALQFIFGSLFSRFFLFYSQSGAFATSWPFMLMLLVLLVGNEVFQKRYSILVFRMSIFFIALFSYTIFAVPIVVGSVGPWVFILSGLVSLIVVHYIVRLVYRLLGERLNYDRVPIYVSFISIFVIINFAYFLNFIPPIPLSIKSAGVYHNVYRTGDTYYGDDEVYSWSKKIWSTKVLHLGAGERLFAYSAVFSPTRINTKIVHNWQRYDRQEKEWYSVSKIEYPISGGRDGGYRGYSSKSNITPGLWRVDVETTRGQVMGRLKFEVVAGKLASTSMRYHVAL